MKALKKLVSILIVITLIFGMFTMVPFTVSAEERTCTIVSWVKADPFTGLEGVEGYYYFPRDSVNNNLIIVCVDKVADPSWGNSKGQTFDLTIPDDGEKQTYTLLGWSDGKMTGDWYKYNNISKLWYQDSYWFIDASNKDNFQFNHSDYDWYAYTWKDATLTYYEGYSDEYSAQKPYYYDNSTDQCYLQVGEIEGKVQLQEASWDDIYHNHYTETDPTWTWSDDGSSATAHFKCDICDYECDRDADVWVDSYEGNIAHKKACVEAFGNNWETTKDFELDFTPVAKVNDTLYPSIEDAEANCGSWDSIWLVTDVTLENTVTITHNLNLDGHTVTYNGTGTAIVANTPSVNGSDSQDYNVRGTINAPNGTAIEYNPNNSWGSINRLNINAGVCGVRFTKTSENSASIDNTTITSGGDGIVVAECAQYTPNIDTNTWDTLYVTAGEQYAPIKAEQDATVALKGGYYNKHVGAVCCAEGYYSPDTPELNGWYTVKLPPAVINTTTNKTYGSLNEALRYCGDSQTVKLMKDIEGESCDDYSYGEGVHYYNNNGNYATIDFNGYQIKDAVYVHSGSHLYFTDSDPDENDEWNLAAVVMPEWEQECTASLNGYVKMKPEGSVQILSGSSLIDISGGTYPCSVISGGLYSAIQIYGGVFTGTLTKNNIEGYDDDAQPKFYLNGGYFSENYDSINDSSEYGFVQVTEGDYAGMYTPSPATAKIGDVKYFSFGDAATAAGENDVIELLSDVGDYTMAENSAIKVKKDNHSLNVAAASLDYVIKTSYDEETEVTTYTTAHAVATLIGYNGNQSFETLQGAIDVSYYSSDVVKLLEDLEENITLNTDSQLDLNGYTLTVTEAIKIENKNPKIIDSSEVQTGKIVADNCNAFTVSITYNYSNAGLTVSGGTINTDSGFMSVAASNASTTGNYVGIHVNGGVLNGAIELCERSQLYMSGGTLSNSDGCAFLTQGQNVDLYVSNTAKIIADKLYDYDNENPRGSLTGGYYSFEPREQDCNYGYIPYGPITEAGDYVGLYAVKKGRFRAHVDGKGYETFDEAVTAAGNGAKIIVLNESVSYTLSPDQTLKIDENGYTAYINAPEDYQLNVNTETVDEKEIKTYTLTHYAAKVGYTGYLTFTEAASAAGNYNNITLLENITDNYTLSVGQTVRVIKNGFDLTVQPPEGYALNVTQSEDVTVYSSLPYIAQVGETKFTDFNDAVTAAEADNNAIITLLDNIYSTYTLEQGKTMNVNLNGKALTVNAPEGCQIIRATYDDYTEYKSMLNVAERDGVFYVSFAEAAQNADGNYIYLHANIDEPYTLSVGETLRVVLNDYQLTVNPPEGYALNTAAEYEATVYTSLPYIAQVGETKYARIAEAAAASNSKNPVILLADIEEAYELPKGKYLYVSKGEYSLTVTPLENYILTEKTNSTTGITTYSASLAAASVNGTLYSTFSAAVAEANDGSAVITIFKTVNYTMKVGETLKINLNENTANIKAPAGYYIVTTEEYGVTTYTYEQGVAKVDDTIYNTFDEAVDAANGTKTIELLNTIPSSEPYQMKSAEETLKVKKNGFSVTVVAPAMYVTASTTEDDITTFYAEEATFETTKANGTKTYSNTFSLLSGDGSTVKLLKDATSTSFPNCGSSMHTNCSVTLDLNEHTLHVNSAYRDYCMLVTSSNTLTVKNGTIDFAPTSADKSNGFCVQNGSKLIIEETATVNAHNGVSAVSVFKNSQLETAGTLTAEDSFAVAANGSSGSGGYTIKVTGGEITATNAPAIYHPNNGTLLISGGTITGPTAVYVKSGTTTITGGTLHANGDANEYIYNGNGANSTGDALVVDNCKYPGGAPSVNISGGSFDSDNAVGIGSYTGNNETELAEVKATSDTIEIAKDMKWVEDGDNFKLVPKEYIAQVGEDKFETFVEAVAAAGGTQAITLLADIEDPYILDVDETLKVKKGEFELTVAPPDGYRVYETTEDEVTTYTAVSLDINFSATLSLEDNISVNLYVNIPEQYDPADVVIQSTYLGETIETPLTKTGVNKIVVAKCAPMQIGENIKIIALYKGNEIKNIDYSVRKYCENKINSPKAKDSLKELCFALLDYGAEAQIKFNYDTENLVNATFSRGKFTEDVPENYKAVIDGNCDSVKGISATLSLEYATELNFYVTPADGKTTSDFTVTVLNSDGEVAENVIVEQTDSIYCARIKNINAKELDQAYSVTVSDGNTSKTITYSPLSYAYRQKGKASEQVTKQMYNYYLKAAAELNKN